jgi:hypothetical protein
MTAARDLAKLAGKLVTASQLDATLGRLLQVGDFGIGGDAIPLASNVSWDTITTPGRYYIPLATGTNVPISGSNLFVDVTKNGSIIKQMAVQQGSALRTDRALVGGTWLAWDRAYNQTSVLGAVTQLNGQPTGALFQYGSNANGEYLKFPDGTMVCMFSLNIGSMGANSAGSYAWTYPAAFASLVRAYVVPASPGGYGYLMRAGMEAIGLASAAFSIINGFSTPMVLTGQLFAIGRWY